jgi:hypothetical protein
VFSEEESAELAKYPEIVATPGMKANLPLGYRKDATTVRVSVGVRSSLRSEANQQPVGRAFSRPPAELPEATTTRSSVRSDNHLGNLR